MVNDTNHGKIYKIENGFERVSDEIYMSIAIMPTGRYSFEDSIAAIGWTFVGLPGKKHHEILKPINGRYENNFLNEFKKAYKVPSEYENDILKFLSNEGKDPKEVLNKLKSDIDEIKLMNEFNGKKPTVYMLAGKLYVPEFMKYYFKKYELGNPFEDEDGNSNSVILPSYHFGRKGIPVDKLSNSILRKFIGVDGKEYNALGIAEENAEIFKKDISNFGKIFVWKIDD